MPTNSAHYIVNCSVGRCQKASCLDKNGKTRANFLVCCNSDGSRKMQLMLIGMALNQHPFKKNTGQELGFDYHEKKKLWMNTSLFKFRKSGLTITTTGPHGRRFLLMINNCSVQGKKETLPLLRHVRVNVIHTYTTSKMQPLDAGIFAWAKAKYKCSLLFRVFNNVDMGQKSI